MHYPETAFKNFLVPMVPNFIETNHLTLTTIFWCFVIIISSFLARYNIQWLWLTSFMIFMQYVTDLLDGEIGRRRNTGLIKWGFYMDHFLDYIFLLSILIGYSMLLPDYYKFLLFYVFALFGAFMVNSFLAFSATNEFQIAYMGIGPTEIRIVFIVINTVLTIFGSKYIAFSLPYVLFFSTVGLCYTVYKTQKHIWKIDMDLKNKNKVKQ